MRLQNSRAIVTGGAAGIGRGIAIELADEGADVAIGDVREEPKRPGEEKPTHKLIKEMGRDSLYVETDVSDEGDAEALVDKTVEEFGGLDILVNNAGININGSVENQPLEDWETVFDVNLNSVFLCSKYAIPHLRQSETGSIINISSQVAFVAWPMNAAYDTSKAAVSHLTRQMAVDLSIDDIRVNAICPGPIKTQHMKESYNEWEIQTAYDRKTLTSFQGEPKDIGRAAAYLASEDARYVNGHNLVVDGGWLAGDFQVG